MLNKKITLMLTNFQEINEVMKDYDVKFFEYYEELRSNFIKILSDIVDNYTYTSPDLQNLANMRGDMDYLKDENEALREEIARLKSKNGVKKPATTQASNTKNPSPLKKIEKAMVQREQMDKEKNGTKHEFGNGLLKWTNARDFNQSLQTLSYKGLSVKQLKDFINELYEAKALYDTGCRKQGQPRESLEQFMYNHLKYKYGKNSVVIEWVFAIIEGIKIYGPSDSDITLFGLVT